MPLQRLKTPSASSLLGRIRLKLTLLSVQDLQAKAKGAKIIVADPRKIQLASYADIFVRQNLEPMLPSSMNYECHSQRGVVR